MSTLFKGLLRTVAQEMQNGNGRISTGKTPLPFELYAELAQWMMCEGTAVGTFCHLFLVLSWNLACRSSNTKTIHYHHMGWVDDSLKVYFAHMKNDQSGERPRDPRHMYANPFDCRVCAILSVFTYFLVYPPSSTQSYLFPGNDQYNRYNKFLKTMLESKREYVMQKYGINVDHIGAHSSRKGASTYMTSGVVGGPSFNAVNIRCGWKMPGVTDTYCRYEAAGDQYCGRVLSGLPLSSFRFATLPPKFIFPEYLKEEGQKKLNCLIDLMFPNMIVELWPVMTYGLATLAMKEAWLRDNLPDNHVMFESSIFIHPIYQWLKPHAKVELGGDSNFEVEDISDVLHRTTTGIPPHVLILSGQRTLAVQQQDLVRSNDQLPDRLVVELSEQLESLGLNENNLNRVVEEMRSFSTAVTERLDRLDNGEQQQSSPILDNEIGIDNGGSMIHVEADGKLIAKL